MEEFTDGRVALGWRLQQHSWTEGTPSSAGQRERGRNGATVLLRTSGSKDGESMAVCEHKDSADSVRFILGAEGSIKVTLA